MHFLILETLSFNLIYVVACYLVGTGMCHNMVGLLQHYHQQGSTEWFVDFNKQQIFTYPFPAKSSGNSNLL